MIKAQKGSKDIVKKSMWHQGFNRNFMKLREYYACVVYVQMKAHTYIKYSRTRDTLQNALVVDADGEELLNKVSFVFFAHKVFLASKNTVE